MTKKGFARDDRRHAPLFDQFPVEGSLAQSSDNNNYFLHRMSVIYGLPRLIYLCHFRHSKGNILIPDFPRCS